MVSHQVGAKKTGYKRKKLRSTLYNPKKPNENFLHPDLTGRALQPIYL